MTVSVYVRTAGHVETPALDLLRWAIDHDEILDGVGPVEPLVPDGPPGHGFAPVRTDRRLDAPKPRVA